MTYKCWPHDRKCDSPPDKLTPHPIVKDQGTEYVDEKKKENGVECRAETVSGRHSSEDAGNNTHTEEGMKNDKERGEQCERWISLKIHTRVD